MPVTVSRDTQELLMEPGIEMLRMFHTFKHRSSILDHFAYYDHVELNRLNGTQNKNNPGRRYNRRHSYAQHRQRMTSDSSKQTNTESGKTKEDQKNGSSGPQDGHQYRRYQRSWHFPNR